MCVRHGTSRMSTRVSMSLRICECTHLPRVCCSTWYPSVSVCGHLGVLCKLHSPTSPRKGDHHHSSDGRPAACAGLLFGAVLGTADRPSPNLEKHRVVHGSGQGNNLRTRPSTGFLCCYRWEPTFVGLWARTVIRMWVLWAVLRAGRGVSPFFRLNKKNNNGHWILL